MLAISEVTNVFSARIIEQDSRVRRVEVSFESIRTEVSRLWYQGLYDVVRVLFRRV